MILWKKCKHEMTHLLHGYVLKAVQAVLDPSILLLPDSNNYQLLAFLPILAIITIVVFRRRK